MQWGCLVWTGDGISNINDNGNGSSNNNNNNNNNDIHRKFSQFSSQTSELRMIVAGRIIIPFIPFHFNSLSDHQQFL